MERKVVSKVAIRLNGFAVQLSFHALVMNNVAASGVRLTAIINVIARRAVKYAGLALMRAVAAGYVIPTENAPGPLLGPSGLVIKDVAPLIENQTSTKVKAQRLSFCIL